MSAIAENIKNFFRKKDNKEEGGPAPEGICPVCWGHSEWDGEYYEIKKDKHKENFENIYENFISKVMDKHVDTQHKHEDHYVCTTCKTRIS